MARAGLSVLGSGYSGKAGTVVFARYRSGQVQIRPRQSGSNPRTPLQQQTRQAMQWANAAFRNLTPEEMLAWKHYAELLADVAWAERRPAQANPLNAYRSLALKFLQVNGLTEPPKLPPTSPFSGDGVLLTATATPQGIRFSASGPNSAGVVTELLLQPLRLSVSNPEPDKYRHQTFAEFTAGSLSADVPSDPGWVSPAIRFVLRATGQSSPLMALGPVLVG